VRLEISGFAPQRLSHVKDVFAGSIAAGEELGARFTLVEAGEVVLDLWAGWADRQRTVAWDEHTLAPVFSTTKALAALMIVRLVDKGKLTYSQTVASVWPEFAAAGKASVTIEQVISHQAGLPGFPELMDPALWLDWDAICGRLAAMTPMWPPGSASGYHPVTVGYITGEIFRRVDGRPLATAFREDIGDPFDLDIWIGLPSGVEARLADLQRPGGLPAFGEVNAATRAAFLTPWSSAAGKAGDDYRRMGVPSTNGYATAAALARLMGGLANDGWLEGGELLSPAMIAEASRERIRHELGRRVHAQSAQLSLGTGRAHLRPRRMGRRLRLRRPGAPTGRRLCDEQAGRRAHGGSAPAAVDRSGLRRSMRPSPPATAATRPTQTPPRPPR
jgi:CubicO group peptidase (beta-lactamase class C family)